MGRYLIWLMAFIGYIHTLDELEILTFLYVIADFVGLLAYFLWTSDNKNK